MLSLCRQRKRPHIMIQVHFFQPGSACQIALTRIFRTTTLAMNTYEDRAVGEYMSW
jgi:hypothetical protein